MLVDPVTDITIAMEIDHFQLNGAEYFVPIMVKIPGSELTLARKGGAEITRLDFIWEVKDNFGSTYTNNRDHMDIKLSDSTAALAASICALAVSTAAFPASICALAALLTSHRPPATQLRVRSRCDGTVSQAARTFSAEADFCAIFLPSSSYLGEYSAVLRQQEPNI